MSDRLFAVLKTSMRSARFLHSSSIQSPSLSRCSVLIYSRSVGKDSRSRRYPT